MLGIVLNKSLTFIKKNNNITKQSIEYNLRTKTIKKNWCVFKVKEKIVKWNSMEPLINNNEKVWYWENYYNKCKSDIKRWDIVIFDIWDWKDIMKVVYGLSWDNISKEWNNIYLNWKIVKNSENNNYTINDNEYAKIKKWVIKWKIKKNNFLLLWENILQSMDSRYYWIIDSNKIKWKVFPKIINELE